MTKNQVRKLVSQRKKELSMEYKEKANQSILRQVLQLTEYKNAETLFCYVSMEDEVNTWPILGFALEQGKRVGVPLCISKGVMEIRQINSFDDLEKGAYGIMEPKKTCPLIDASDIELGIIPCVSADMEKRRLGHGAGFYDRYLQNTVFPKVLLCWKKLMISQIPTDEHDIKMDRIIFEADEIF